MADVVETGDDGSADDPRLTAELLSNDGGVLTFKVGGQLDVSTEDVLKSTLAEVVDAGDLAKVVIDVSELDFMDSSGLAVLLVVAGEVPRFELHNPTRVVRRVVTIAGLAETLRMVPDA